MAVHEALNQRVVVRYQLGGLTRDELPRYLAHLLRRAGTNCPSSSRPRRRPFFQATRTAATSESPRTTCFDCRRARKGKGRLRRARPGRAAGGLVNAPRSLSDLTIAPEALTLHILDVALAAAHNALAVVHPDRDALSEVYSGGLPPLSVLLAALLLDRLAEMRELLGRYRASYRADVTTRHDDYPF